MSSGKDKRNQLVDLDPTNFFPILGQYHNFVCVEAGSVAERIVLEPGSDWLGGQILEIQRHR